MANTFSRLTDLIEHCGKNAAKTFYRQPVIAAARAWRNSMLRNTCGIGITGSAGKTTTKDLLHAVIASHVPCSRSHDSNNQLYSIARTLVGTGTSAKYLIQELGASKPGGFDPMLALLRPCIGVVTTIGNEHFKEFRSPDAVAREKGKLIESLPSNGIAVLNADDERVLAMSTTCRGRVITYGLGSGNDLHGEVVDCRWPNPLSLRVNWRGSTTQIETRLHGRHQATAVMAAIATACALGIPLEKATAVERVEPLRGRMSCYSTVSGIHFLPDDWKSPVWSMPLAFDFLRDANAPRKFIVLGTLSDYGGDARKVYRQMTQKALAVSNHVVLIGDRAESVVRYLAPNAEGRIHGFPDIRSASAWLLHTLTPGDLVLLKGSNRADHLTRLALVFDQDVGCWRRRCGRQIFCENCRLLGNIASEGA